MPREKQDEKKPDEGCAPHGCPVVLRMEAEGNYVEFEVDEDADTDPVHGVLCCRMPKKGPQSDDYEDVDPEVLGRGASYFKEALVLCRVHGSAMHDGFPYKPCNVDRFADEYFTEYGIDTFWAHQPGEAPIAEAPVAPKGKGKGKGGGRSSSGSGGQLPAGVDGVESDGYNHGVGEAADGLNPMVMGGAVGALIMVIVAVLFMVMRRRRKRAAKGIRKETEMGNVVDAENVVPDNSEEVVAEKQEGTETVVNVLAVAVPESDGGAVAIDVV